MWNAPNVFIQNGLASLAMIGTKKENGFERAEFSAPQRVSGRGFLCLSEAVHGVEKK